MVEGAFYGHALAGVRVHKVQRVLRFDSGFAAEGSGGRPQKRGASLYKTFTTALTGEGKTSQPRLRREGNAPPLVAGATTFAPVGSVSLDSQSPKGSLRIQFPCHPASGGTMGAEQCAI